QQRGHDLGADALARRPEHVVRRLVRRVHEDLVRARRHARLEEMALEVEERLLVELPPELPAREIEAGVDSAAGARSAGSATAAAGRGSRSVTAGRARSEIG